MKTNHRVKVKNLGNLIYSWFQLRLHLYAAQQKWGIIECVFNNYTILTLHLWGAFSSGIWLALPGGQLFHWTGESLRTPQRKHTTWSSLPSLLPLALSVRFMIPNERSSFILQYFSISVGGCGGFIGMILASIFKWSFICLSSFFLYINLIFVFQLQLTFNYFIIVSGIQHSG